MNQKLFFMMVISLYQFNYIESYSKTEIDLQSEKLNQGIFDHNLAAIEEAIENGADINNRLYRKQTPLILAINETQTDIILYLIEAGANLNLQNNYGYTPLMKVVNISPYDAKITIVKKLLEKGVDTSLVSSDKQSALDLAYQLDYDDTCKNEIIRLLESKQPIWVRLAQAFRSIFS